MTHLKRPNSLHIFLKRWGLELVSALLLLVGLILLTNAQYLIVLVDFYARFFKNLAAGFIRSVFEIEPTTGFGILIVLVALALIRWRVNYQISLTPTLRSAYCPLCKSPIERSHRRRWERIVGVFLAMRPYRCSTPTCPWRGWRYWMRG